MMLFGTSCVRLFVKTTNGLAELRYIAVAVAVTAVQSSVDSGWKKLGSGRDRGDL